MKNNKIDKKLKAWSANLAPNPEGKERVARNVMRELDAVDRQKAFKISEVSATTFPWLKATGIAATLCLAFLAGKWMNTPPAQETNPPSGMVSISPEEIRHMRRVVSEMDGVFSDDFRWLKLTNDGDPVIATGKRKAINGGNNKILVRYVVVKRKAGDKRWARIHVSELVTNNGEPVEMQGADHGSIWIFTANTNVYAIQAKLSIKANGETINLRYNGGQSLLSPLCVKTIKNADAEYRVYQEIARI